MSSAFFPRHEPPSRTWWSLSPKASNPTDHDLRSGYSTEKLSRQSSSKSLSFNTFASAMGFRSKKHPSLAIQNPPPPINPITPPAGTASTPYATRYPSKSTSSTRSSLEPRTPVDTQRDQHHSLLTLSDIDPFAGRGISVPHLHTPSDPNRLSSYSSSSIPDFISKNPEPVFNRGSYASSSSHSNQYGSELPFPSLALPTADNPTAQRLKAKTSACSLARKPSSIAPDSSPVPAHGHQLTIVKLGSTSTLTDKNRLSQPDPTPTTRPPMRARGMTDSGTTQQSGFLQQGASSPKAKPPVTKSQTNPHRITSPVSSPRVIIRQASASRINSPPSAPPKHELPPPPPDLIAKDNGSEAIVGASTGSASSSSLSFASSVSLNQDILVTQPHSSHRKGKGSMEYISFSSNKVDEEVSSGTSKVPHNPSVAPRTLKKALSHQSLVKRSFSTHSVAPTPSPERVIEKSPRKQRSFHQPKVPAVPPVPSPVRHVNSFGSQPLTPTSASGTDQKKSNGNGAPTSGRRRLFSGSSHRRPSTSQGILSEDDTVSVFSVRSERGPSSSSSPLKPLSPTASKSFWDEGTHTVPSSPLPAAYEYTPQQIMSPAEMAQVEASMEESSSHVRTRGLSILSASTMEDEDPVLTGLSPHALKWNTEKSDNPLIRSGSLMSNGLMVSPRLPAQPSTSQANMSSPTISPSTKPPLSFPRAMTSLPPPPRPRTRPAIPHVLQEGGITPLPPPPGRRNLRSKVSVHRQSIMRKPSFLDIDDDTDKDSETESVRKPLTGSFLDLARESFDSVRSISE